MKYIPYVNIKQGSASISRFSNGNTLPLVQRPFGMAPFCLQSDAGGGRWFFHPDHPCTEGIRLTHQPSPWINDYGTFSIMPLSGDLQVDNRFRGREFSHENEVAKPYLYQLK